MVELHYINITKYLKLWALKTYQVLIISKLIDNKSKLGIKFLVNYLISILAKPF